MSANDRQHGGNHYNKMLIQPWDFCSINQINYLESEAIAYLCRWSDKGGMEDLEKARHFIEKAIEFYSGTPEEALNRLYGTVNGSDADQFVTIENTPVWLIKRGGTILGFKKIRDFGEIGWTVDVELALQFVREIDAKVMCQKGEIAVSMNL